MSRSTIPAICSPRQAHEFPRSTGLGIVQGKSDAIVGVSHSSLSAFSFHERWSPPSACRAQFSYTSTTPEYCTRIKDAGFRMLLVPGVSWCQERRRAVGGGRGRVGDPVQMDRLWIYYGIRNAVWYKKTYCSTASHSSGTLPLRQVRARDRSVPDNKLSGCGSVRRSSAGCAARSTTTNRAVARAREVAFGERRTRPRSEADCPPSALLGHLS